jgi:hypothetical protein
MSSERTQLSEIRGLCSYNASVDRLLSAALFNRWPNSLLIYCQSKHKLHKAESLFRSCYSPSWSRNLALLLHNSSLHYGVKVIMSLNSVLDNVSCSPHMLIFYWMQFIFYPPSKFGSKFFFSEVLKQKNLNLFSTGSCERGSKLSLSIKLGKFLD